MHLPNDVRVVEVGPRDGLQNEKDPLSVEQRVQLVNALARAGVSSVEVGSFVSPKWVPAMAASDEVFRKIERRPGTVYSALVPNERGLEGALESNVSEIAVFISASESFSKRNINCSIEESFERLKPVFDKAFKASIPVRGYLSCVAGCPYEGAISPAVVAELSRRLVETGCYEVSLGDTIGVATPPVVADVLDQVFSVVKVSKVAVHFHDTYGYALANVFQALQHGVSVVDSAIAGLGGCPYARGASGNLCTEDLVHFLQDLGINTGLDLDGLMATGNWVSEQLGRRSLAKVSAARARE
ncbi:hydroxymethylglutaryl-CoA lyase [Marinimicrobium sp. LS-A18]|uniref:hydroxymethylglutaryl-CoA lyase n=1 Tax=Marinimicrobium sp. LS-A18 TaxID=1381596 RepID=UPI0004673443|nr:hydroxymethylglutaryl-CoA lyase [Marinimicrobium sp. LS-A18]